MFLPLQLPGVDQEDIAEADSLLKANLRAEVRSLKGMTWEDRFHAIWDELLKVGLKVVVVIAIFLVGRWIIRRITKLLDTIFEKRHVDPSLRSFIRGIVDIFLYIVLFYLMIAWLGVNTSLFVALFAAAGLAIGMALSGVFQNFAGGVMILLLKPFRVGDWIEVQNQTGKVIDIRLFNTILRTADNKTILLPNGSVSTGIVNNYNTAGTRRIEWLVSLPVGTDFTAVQKLLMELINAEPRVLPDPAPEVILNKLNPNAIDVAAHGWVNAGDYADVQVSMNATIYKTLPEKGFKLPSAQLDVMVVNK